VYFRNLTDLEFVECVLISTKSTPTEIELSKRLKYFLDKNDNLEKSTRELTTTEVSND